MLTKLDHKIRDVSGDLLHVFEVSLYAGVGLLLSVSAIAVLFGAAKVLWQGVVHGALAEYGLQALEQLLLVLVLVEILHTVSMSIRSREIIIEPFLIVGLIASVRRVLVIAMEASHLQGDPHDIAASFNRSMTELGVVGALVLIFVISLYILRRAQPAAAVEGSPASDGGDFR